jgi:hypothetical protein
MHKLTTIFFAAFFLLLSRSLFSQCTIGHYNVRVEIVPDEFFNEISWRMNDVGQTTVFTSGNCTSRDTLVIKVCVPDSVCAVFTIQDEEGDGLLPDGHYRIFIKDSLVQEGRDYAFSETTYLQCQPGASCVTALPVDTGLIITPSTSEYWGKFIPSVTGTYRLSTCQGNSCPVKVWIYETCENIYITDNQLGTIFYAASGCDSGAVATLYLAENKEYIIRLAHAQRSCSPTPVTARLSYEGPVRGCMDVRACNYQPLATLNDTCYYPGDINCTDGPDFTVVEETLRRSVQLDSIHNPDQCMIKEGCIRGPGIRHVIRFETHFENIGNRDYYIGTPPNSLNHSDPRFVWDPCHQHWHYRGYAEYVLKDQNGSIPIGFKNGFCVLDFLCEKGRPKYTCNLMGVSAGCGDIYDVSLPCQLIDITDLAAGLYTLAIRVNWNRQADTLGRYEQRYDNNVAQVCFRLGYNDKQPVVEWLDVDCEEYRDCNGVLLGNAVPDCTGICNGPNKYGDTNKDSLQNLVDVDAIMTRLMENDTLITPCTDLYADSVLNVTDAALLLECVLHANDPAYWGRRFSCHFPVLKDRLNGLSYLYAGKIDTLAKTFDVRIFNSLQLISAFEFSVSGLVIDSVKSLSQFQGDIRFNAQGKIVGLATEKFIQKNALPSPMLRIYYKKITASEICLEEARAMTDNQYRPVNVRLSSVRCTKAPLSVAIQEPDTEDSFSIVVQPNPLYDQATVFIERFSDHPLQLMLTNMTGQIVRVWKDVTAPTLEIERNDLPAGIYQLWANDGMQQNVFKIMMQGQH